MDWAKQRENFPAVNEQKYFISAASGPLHKNVFEAYENFNRRLYQFGDTDWERSLTTMQSTRELFKQYLDCSSNNDIGFGASTSYNMNILALMIKQKNPEAVVLMPDEEFPSSSLPYIHNKLNVIMVPVTGFAEAIERLKPDFVVCSAVQYSTGYRMNLTNISNITHELKIPLIINATQALGAFKVSVKDIKPTAVVGSCHKWLCAGYGVSVMYLDKSFREQYTWPLAGWLSVENIEAMSNKVNNLSTETRAIETGLLPFATIYGVEAALDVVLKLGIDNISLRILELSSYLEKHLKEKNIKILSHRDELDWKNSVNSGIIAIEHSNPEQKVEELAKENIFVSTRAGKIRISTHYFNSEDDIDALVESL